MRIHGDKVIKRRTDIRKCTDYHDYLPELRKDFHYMCGYCGKTEMVTKNAFEIDHFIPLKYAKNLISDYSNLVYSCYVCNRKKSGKWPSADAKVQFKDEKGFADPATQDYDKHLERRKNGTICGKTKAGKYMTEEAFEFHIRPMREVWQLMQLAEKKKQLREKTASLTSEEKTKYIQADEMLEKLQIFLFEKKE